MSRRPTDIMDRSQPPHCFVARLDHLIRDLQRGLSGEIPYDYITTLEHYDARILLVFAGTSSGPDSYCTGAVVSKFGALGNAQELFHMFERLRDESRRQQQLQRADDGRRCYFYLDSGFRHDSPVGRGPSD